MRHLTNVYWVVTCIVLLHIQGIGSVDLDVANLYSKIFPEAACMFLMSLRKIFSAIQGEMLKRICMKGWDRALPSMLLKCYSGLCGEIILD